MRGVRVKKESDHAGLGEQVSDFVDLLRPELAATGRDLSVRAMTNAEYPAHHVRRLVTGALSLNNSYFEPTHKSLKHHRPNS